MSGMLAWLLCLSVPLALQDEPFQQQIDDAVRQFQAAQEVEQALVLLSSQLTTLGLQATSPIARRLAQDLRDGMAFAAAPAFIDALNGRPEALGPLQTAFRDATTSAAGRIELASALLQLDDTMSWREGLISIAGDPRVRLIDRLHAIDVLHEAEEPRVPGLYHSILDALPGHPEGEQRQVVDHLAQSGTPDSKLLLGEIVVDERLPQGTREAAILALHAPAARGGAEEPSEKILDDPPRLTSTQASARAVTKKKETREETFLTMPRIIAGGVTLVLLVLLGVEVLRKG